MNFINKKLIKGQGGFSLMEMVVVLAIFTISSVIIADIFITLINVQRKIIVQQKVLSEARYTMDIISRHIRMGTISYSDYTDPIVVPYEEKLYLKDIDDYKTFFKLCDTAAACAFCPTDIDKCLIMSIDKGNNWESITSKNIEIQDLRFYIRPHDDPFEVGSPPNIQPRVTILLNIKSSAELSHHQSEITLQSSVSTRIYNR